MAQNRDRTEELQLLEGEEFADALGHFDGTRTNENRLFAAVNLENLQRDATELGFFCFINDIR